MATVPAPVRIRRARSEDLVAMWSVEKKVIEERLRASRDSLVRSLASDAQRVWVAESGGRIVAFLIAWFRSRTWRIYDVTAPRTPKGDEAARTLLLAAEQTARAAGAEFVAVEAPAERVSFYAPLGYAVVAELADRYGAGRAAVQLEKRVGPSR